MKNSLSFYSASVILLLIFSCKKDSQEIQHAAATSSSPEVETLILDQPVSDEFKAYWYANEQVKAEQSSATNISVLKLNATKNFHTGIYPYAIMQSTFYPVTNNQHALKISCSVQEWCGHTYTQLNNRSEFEVTSHSYFEAEADEDFSLSKAILENEIWTQLRINPKSLPIGDMEIIPSFEFLRLEHIPFKAYSASADLISDTYTISYPDLNRSLSITFNPQFPFDIISWEEIFISGYGENAKTLTTKATRQKTIKSDYWNKNTNDDFSLRESLGLN